MKIDFKQRLKDMDGGDLLASSKPEEFWVLEVVCVNSLLGGVEGEKISGEEKYERYELARKVKKGEEVSTEEIVKIKKLIGDVYPAIIVGSAWEILEGE